MGEPAWEAASPRCLS